MCLIVYKPRGIKLPPDKEIAEAMDTNSDGFGYMYLKDNYIHIVKGAMNPNEVELLFNQLPDDINQLPMVMHFRLATHGSVNPANCHPFPITTDKGVLGLTELECKTAVAHNGIIPSKFVDAKYVKRVWVQGKKQPDDEDELSDTGLFVREYLAPMGKAIFNQVVGKLLSTVGKMAILDAKRGCILIGDFTRDNDRFYSNDTYKSRTSGYYRNGKDNHWKGYNADDDDEDNPLYEALGMGWANLAGNQYKYSGYGKCDFCNQSFALWEVDDVIGDLCWKCLNKWNDLLVKEKEDWRRAILQMESQIVLPVEDDDEDIVAPLQSDEEKRKSYQEYKKEQKQKGSTELLTQGNNLQGDRVHYNRLGERVA